MKPLKLNFGISRGTTDDTNYDEGHFEQILGDTLLRDDNLFIIGSEAIFKQDTKGTQNTGDSLILLFNAIADLIKDPEKGRPQNEHDWHLWFKMKKLERSVCETAWNSKRFEIQSEDLSPELIDFLDNGINYCLIHTIFTTCIDPTLEVLIDALCKEHGKSLTVYNFKGDNQIPAYMENMKNKSKDNVVLVYLWGKFGDTEHTLGKKNIDYVFTEDDAMVTIADYIKKANDNTVDLFRKIFFSQRIMAIGCRFDDWKFRFFWYSIRGNLDQMSYGTVSYSCLDTEKDPLYQYLMNTKGLHVDNDSRRFMKKLSDVMESASLFDRIRNKRVRDSKGIFISYPSEDVLTASNLFHYFVDRCHFNTWMDAQALTIADRYNEKIQAAIRDCGIFVPILSSQVVSDFKKGEMNRYYMKEWKEARNNGRTIVPISVGEYDCRNGYHEMFKEMCGFCGEKDITVLPLTQIDKIAEKLKDLLSE